MNKKLNINNSALNNILFNILPVLPLLGFTIFLLHFFLVMKRFISNINVIILSPES